MPAARTPRHNQGPGIMPEQVRVDALTDSRPLRAAHQFGREDASIEDLAPARDEDRILERDSAERAARLPDLAEQTE